MPIVNDAGAHWSTVLDATALAHLCDEPANGKVDLTVETQAPSVSLGGRSVEVPQVPNPVSLQGDEEAPNV